ncbi:hypothetical protein L2E82_39245 [Cichorium intybus]|uniref:Uncharacterized protein n=1 Tax=Cichorium intybus TaxID=13427 RepID=A0ACB9AI10_CICIN|nr:hypothetical protein L2E82_39245 [Cichorium intybus]
MISHACSKSIQYSQPGNILNPTYNALSIKSSGYVHNTSDLSKRLEEPDQLGSPMLPAVGLLIRTIFSVLPLPGSVDLILPLKSLNTSRFQSIAYSDKRSHICMQSSPDSKSTDSKILSIGSLGDSFLATINFIKHSIHYLHIQSEYAPVRQYPASYRVRAYRANVRNTSCIKEMRISLKHRTIGPDDLDHFLMHLDTGLNPEAAELMELCFSMNDSYRVDIECTSTIVLSGYPFCSSG